MTRIIDSFKGDSEVKGGMGAGGYVKEYVTFVWKPLMKDILDRGIKVITNAGGSLSIISLSYLQE
jgi:hypothetical protein